MEAVHDPVPAADGGWRRALPAILGIFLASRVLLLLVVAVVEATLPLAGDRPTYSTTPLLGGLTGHDAIYYLGVAADGYHLEPVAGQFRDWVFFPLFPLLTRIVSFATFGDVSLAGVLVANASLLIAMIAIHRTVRANGGSPETALTAVFLVAAGPGSVAFGMAYSDSLMLACITWAMLAADAGRHRQMGVLFALAVLSRPPGILFGAALLAALIARGGRRPSRAWLALGMGPLALLGFSAYQGAVLGDPLAFIRAQGAWDIPTIAGPLASADGVGSVAPLIVLLLATLLFYTALVPGLLRGRFPRRYVAMALVAFGSVFASGRLQSDARYLAAGWPFAWHVALARNWAGRLLVPGISAALYVLFAFLHVTQALAP